MDFSSEYLTLKNVKCLVAEFLGTALLVFLGLASCLNWTHTVDHDQLIRIAFTFGFALAGIIYAFGPISGAHVNPAVTIACVIAGRIDGVLGVAYIIFQYVGAISGAGLLYFLQAERYEGHRATLFGVTQVNQDLSLEQGLFSEFITTYIFVLIILLITDKNCSDFSRGSVALGIGFTLAAIEMGFINATGGSVNPARSLGPALIVLHFQQLWVYMVGPIFGGVLASVTYRLLIYERQRKTTLDGGAQTADEIEGIIGENSNFVFVSADPNNISSFDEIIIEDDVKNKK